MEHAVAVVVRPTVYLQVDALLGGAFLVGVEGRVVDGGPGTDLDGARGELVGWVAGNVQWDEEVRAIVLVPVPCVVLATAATVASAIPDEDGVLQRGEGRWGEAQQEVGVTGVVEG